MKNRISSPKSSSSGIALVIVLTMLVLLAGLIVSFMTSASTEATSSKSFSYQMEARQASDAAVNFVIGQIRDATTNVDDGASLDPSKGPRGFTWASQPGAITTFGSSNSTLYKLYSADEMRVPAGDVAKLRETLAAEAAISLVDQDKLSEIERNSYVDLNEPVMVPVAGSAASEGKLEARYPIVSPYGSYSYDQSSNKFTTKPSAAGTGAIEGFICEDRPHPGNLNDANGNAVPVLPMMVKWMYILQDGSFAKVDQQGKIVGATAANPPVARTAFWTDDDSAKLNINTATEGSYWDVPSIGTLQESGDVTTAGVLTGALTSLNFATAQPVRNEFQRYPGHPATTSLSPALRWLFPGYKPVIPTSDRDVQFREAIYRMAPRFVGGLKGTNPDGKNHLGTSQAGTVNTDVPGTLPGSTAPIATDKERLFATLDEYFFRPDRTGRDTNPAQDAYKGQDVANLKFVPEHLEKLRFFLTANSRSPELNLFGKPRVTVWPVHADVAKQTAFDDLFQFCSTLGKKGYFFYRRNPLSGTDDYTNSPNGQNKRVYEYLQDVTQREVPWLGDSILSKYVSSSAGANRALSRDQVLTEIFDYIRTTNLVDTSNNKTGVAYAAAYTPFFWGSGAKQAAMPQPFSGQVVPINITTSNGETQGFGRFITISEAALLFYRPTIFSPQGTTPPAGTVPLQAVLLLEMFTPAQGYPALRDTYSVRVRIGETDPDLRLTQSIATNPDKFEVRNPGNQADFKPLQFAFDAFNIVTVDPYSGPIGRVFMPFRGFANQLIYDPQWNGSLTGTPNGPVATAFNQANWDRTIKKTFKRNTFPSGDHTAYPFFSDTVFIPNTAPATWGGAFGMKGGTFIIDIYGTTKPSAVEKPVQTIRIKFEDVPRLTLPTSSDFQNRLTKGLNSSRGQLDANNTSSGYQWIEGGDVIRSYEVGGLTRGDHRLVAALPNVGHGVAMGRNYYMPRGGINNYKGTAQRIYGLRVSRGGAYPTGNVSTYTVQDGKLAQGVTSYRTDRWPRVPWDTTTNAPIDGVRMSNNKPGDWDRGISKNVDGAFIGKSDEGNQNFDYGRTGGTRLPYFLGFSGFEEAGPTFFSPNRLMPSPVVFGSLPTRILDSNARPWETLLFRPPIITGGIPDHEGFKIVPDHFYLDLFHMPVVEPYAISEPFSTAGKVNLNYEIAPFGYAKAKGNGAYNLPLYYLERKTALYGVLRSMKMLAVGGTAASAGHQEDPTTNNELWRFHVDRKATVALMQQRLEKQGLFKTASELCEIPMVPEAAPGMSANPLTQNWSTFWDTTYKLTGDNQREKPYAHVYPRVTTRSNVFTVYVRAQAIRKSPTSDPEVFDERKDKVASEYRGQVTLERYVDANDPALEKYDPASNNPAGGSTEGGSADRYYRFRIVNTKQFTGN